MEVQARRLVEIWRLCFGLAQDYFKCMYFYCLLGASLVEITEFLFYFSSRIPLSIMTSVRFENYSLLLSFPASLCAALLWKPHSPAEPLFRGPPPLPPTRPITVCSEPVGWLNGSATR